MSISQRYLKTIYSKGLANMKNDEKLLTTKEAAKILGVEPSTILSYVHDKKLHTYMPDPYQIASTKLFTEQEINRFKQENKKPGLTTGDVAKLLKIHHQTVNTYIKNGELKATKKPYRGKDIYFVDEKDFEEFSQSYQNVKKQGMKEFFIKKKKIALYQLYRNELTHEYARIMNLTKDGDGYFKTNQDRMIHLNDDEANEFLPIYIVKELRYIQKKGYVIFEFNQTGDIMSPVFRIIDLLYKHAGPKNMKLLVTDKIHVEVKPLVLELETQYLQEEINLLITHLKEGKVQYDSKTIVLESDVEPLIITLPLELKMKIKRDAENAGLSMDEFIVSIINEKYEEEEK